MLGEVKEITDDYEFPFGKYKGDKIGRVPADYLDWLDGQAWIEKYPHIVDYIKRNRKVIDLELKRAGKI